MTTSGSRAEEPATAPSPRASTISWSNGLGLSQRVVVWLCLTLLDTGYPVVLFGCEFAADGDTAYRIFSANGEVYVEQNDAFSVGVRDCSWFIREIPKRFIKAGKEQPLVASRIASSDGTNFYQLTFPSGNMRGATAKKTRSPALTGRIGPGSVPFGLTDPKLIVLWYAFASSPYFHDLDGRYLHPPTVFIGEDQYAKDFRVSAFWKLQASAPFLPEWIVFDELRKCEADLRPARMYKEELYFTNCVYTAKTFTRSGPLTLPKLIEVQYFARNPTNKASIILTGTLRIEARSFQDKVVVENFVPGVPEPSLLSDMRTISATTPFGVATLGGREWPRLEESQKRASALATRRTKPQSVITRAPHPALPLILVGVLLSPILLVVIHKWSRKLKG